MKISNLLSIPRGITAIIGGGGKTTLMYALAEELEGSVIITTSTRIWPPEMYTTLLSPTTAEVSAALSEHRVICVASPAEGGKLSASPISCDMLERLSDYVIVEADGSKGLPLKAHNLREPVIPENVKRTILVIGADGFGGRISDVCHRPERYGEISGVSTDTVVTPEIAARIILAEKYGDCVFVNKAETEADYARAWELASFLNCPVVCGSLHRGVYTRCG